MKMDELKKLAKELPVHAPDPSRSDLLRARLLQAAEGEQPHAAGTTPWGRGLVLAALVAGVAFFIGRNQGDSEGQRNVLRPVAALSSPDGASFEHQIRSHKRSGKLVVVEEVSLSKGRLEVDLQGIRHRELVLRTSDARVSGDSATLFDVSAEGGSLQSVRVSRGQVRIEIENQGAIVLGPGQSWLAPITETIELAVAPEAIGEVVATEEVAATEEAGVLDSEPVTPPGSSAAELAPKSKMRTEVPSAVSVGPETSLSKRPGLAPGKTMLSEVPVAEESLAPTEEEVPEQVTRPERVASAAELAFDSGYRALKAGDYGEAISLFESAIQNGNDDAMRGDSRYWRSIALAKAGQKQKSMRSFSDFLKHHGESSRAGEAATILGWFYVEEGRLERAAGLFEQARDDLSPRVRASARAGLEAIADALP